MAPRRNPRRKARRRQPLPDPDPDPDPMSDDEAETTIESCLKALGIETAALSERCSTIQDEFKHIKRAYFRQILVAHPDKGGDPETFRELNTAFEALRGWYEKNHLTSFVTHTSTHVESTHDVVVDGVPTQSWDFYAEAAQEDVPLYRVELAKSGRSKCIKSKERIEKNTIRIGSINMESGSYGRWCRLASWRVPSRIWAGLPDPDDTCSTDPLAALFHTALSRMNEVLFCGFNELNPEAQSLVVAHVMNKSNWAKFVPRRQVHRKENDRAENQHNADDAKDDVPLIKQEKTQEKQVKTKRMKEETQQLASKPIKKQRASSTNKDLIVQDKPNQEIVVARPPQNALAFAPSTALQGKTVVLTGIFPEIGGGAGLNLGKDRLKGMLQRMGAKVRGSVSGKTDMVVVGKNPGMAKVSAARSRPSCQLVGIQDLKLAINEGTTKLESLPEPEITEYSSGYNGNGLGRLEGPRYGRYLP